MGAWGFEPTDNDTAADWFHGLGALGLFNFIESGLNSPNACEIRAAAWLVHQLGDNFVYDICKREAHIELAINKIKRLLDNKSYMESWSDEEEIKISLRAQIKELRLL